MAEYITIQNAIRTTWMILEGLGFRESENGELAKTVEEVFDTAPAADVNPVVHSRWEINCDGYYPYCMNCKKEPPGRVMTDFCPNCGADMRGEKNNV